MALLCARTPTSLRWLRTVLAFTFLTPTISVQHTSLARLRATASRLPYHASLCRPTVPEALSSGSDGPYPGFRDARARDRRKDRCWATWKQPHPRNGVRRTPCQGTEVFRTGTLYRVGGGGGGLVSAQGNFQGLPRRPAHLWQYLPSTAREGMQAKVSSAPFLGCVVPLLHWVALLQTTANVMSGALMMKCTSTTERTAFRPRPAGSPAPRAGWARGTGTAGSRDRQPCPLSSLDQGTSWHPTPHASRANGGSCFAAVECTHPR